MMATADDQGSPASATRVARSYLLWFSTGSLAVLFLALSASQNWHQDNEESKTLAVFKTRQSKSSNRSALSKATLKKLLNNTSTVPSNKSSTISFVPPCGVAKNVIESTSSLLVATALVNADNVTLQTYDLWQFFDGLFAVPSSGFIPRFLYPVKKQTTNSTLYVPNTRIPNWSFFASRNATESSSSPCRKNETLCWVGSGRISAIPFHATILLELVLQMQKRDSVSENDMARLRHYWESIFDYHAYLHDIVMRGCNNHTEIPCYNILHPWESLIDSASPIWQDALQPTLTRIESLNWSLPFAVPEQVKQSYDYKETTYTAMVFLTECMANQTRNVSSTDQHNYPYEYNGDAAVHEGQILKNCPFAMLDVGYAAALAQSDDDLYTAAQWLSSQQSMVGLQHSSSSSWSSKLARFKLWTRQNKHVMHLLWNKQERSFLSLYAAHWTSKPLPAMQYSKTAVANNLMVFWKDWGDDTTIPSSISLVKQKDDPHLQDMALQLLRHKGKYSFDCASYPIWSAGCEDETSSIVDPRLNYFIGLGLSRNRDNVVAFGAYLTNVTIDLICGMDRQDESSFTACANNLTRFQEAYAAAPGTTLAMDECGRTSTSTLSILYHLLIDDFDFSSETPIPPIRNSWVITLITVELLIAFAVGVTCVALSLSIVRRENNSSQTTPVEDGDGSYTVPQHNLDDGGDRSTIEAETEQDIE
jgi:hypothetical protein